MQHPAEPPPAAVTASTPNTDARRFERRENPDRKAADTGYQEAARAGHPISQRPTPGDAERVRLALVGDIPAHVGLTEEQLRAFTRGEIDRVDLPDYAQCRFKELAQRLGGQLWPRKIAAVLWGMHEQAKANRK